MKKTIILFLTGGILYVLLEVISRGYSHISMFVAGGICLCLIYYVCNRALNKQDMFIKCAVGAVIITCVELITGYIVNIELHLNVWDYSYQPYDFLGQICLPYTIAWFFLTMPTIFLCRLFDYKAADTTVKIIKQYPTNLIRIK